MSRFRHGDPAGDAAGPLDYDQSKDLARHPDPAVRLRLARRTDLQPEVLYYLAEDQVADVRREIAGNAAAPRQADLLLAIDGNPTVRHAVACKIAAIAPGLSHEQREQVRRLTEDLIETLARDQAVRVRQVVAEALKDLTDASPEVIGRLARDAELAVAAPILEHSPVLLDTDLLDIIASGPIRGALAAIARRSNLAMEVSDAIVGAAVSRPAEAPAITALLANRSAQIREETLDRILDRAPDVGDWHAPLVRRPALPQRAMRRLAGFVAHALLEILQRRDDLDPATARAVAAVVERRLIDEAGAGEDGGAKEDGAVPGSAATPAGEEAFAAAIARGDHRGVAEALARDAGLPKEQVERMLQSRSAKGVTALAWKAGLPVRLAVQLQLRVAGIAPRAALNPREGVLYPLSDQEMSWQIEFFAGM
jgi:uncharacterized protein (DUF2336 family)